VHFSFLVLSFVPLVLQFATVLMPAIWIRAQSDSWPSRVERTPTEKFLEFDVTGGPEAPDRVVNMALIALLVQAVLFLPSLWLLIVHATERLPGSLPLSLVWTLPTAWCVLGMAGYLGSLGQFHRWVLY